MALSPEAMDDLKKLVATQVAEAMTQLLPQQISKKLTFERDKQAKEKEVTSESESGHTPTPSEAMRIAKGKGIADTSRFIAIRNIHPINAEKEQRVHDNGHMLSLVSKKKELQDVGDTLLHTVQPRP
ncbi:unnamed protein product [Cochlearia groenlandica]